MAAEHYQSVTLRANQPEQQQHHKQNELEHSRRRAGWGNYLLRTGGLRGVQAAEEPRPGDGEATPCGGVGDSMRRRRACELVAEGGVESPWSMGSSLQLLELSRWTGIQDQDHCLEPSGAGETSLETD